MVSSDRSEIFRRAAIHSVLSIGRPCIGTFTTRNRRIIIAEHGNDQSFPSLRRDPRGGQMVGEHRLLAVEDGEMAGAIEQRLRSLHRSVHLGNGEARPIAAGLVDDPASVNPITGIIAGLLNVEQHNVPENPLERRRVDLVHRRLSSR